MPQNIHSDGFHVLRRHVSSALEKRIRLRHDRQIQRRPRRCPPLDELLDVQPVLLRLPRREHDVHDVFLDLVININLVHHRPRTKNVLRRNHRLHLNQLLRERHPLENLKLILPVGIDDLQFEHEPVHLRLRQRIRPLLLDGILRRQDQERLVERKRLLADGHLLFLHGFQERALHLCRGAIHLVRQNDIRENRTLLDREIPRPRIVNQRPDEVCRQQVWRELNPLKPHPERPRERRHRHRLRQTGDALEQHVPVRQHSQEEPLHHVLLPDNHLAYLVHHPLDETAFLPDFLTDSLDIYVHTFPFLSQRPRERLRKPSAFSAVRVPFFISIENKRHTASVKRATPKAWSQSRKERKEGGVLHSWRLRVLARKKAAPHSHFHGLRVNEVHERLRSLAVAPAQANPESPVQNPKWFHFRFRPKYNHIRPPLDLGSRVAVFSEP